MRPAEREKDNTNDDTPDDNSVVDDVDPADVATDNDDESEPLEQDAAAVPEPSRAELRLIEQAMPTIMREAGSSNSCNSANSCGSGRFQDAIEEGLAIATLADSADSVTTPVPDEHWVEVFAHWAKETAEGARVADDRERAVATRTPLAYGEFVLLQHRFLEDDLLSIVHLTSIKSMSGQIARLKGDR